MTIEEFRRKVLNSSITDKEIRRLYLKIEIRNDEDVHKTMALLRKHRPNVVNNFSANEIYYHYFKLVEKNRMEK